MRNKTPIPIIALLLLLLALPASAQTPASVDVLDVKLWPEFDDPRLLVIIDGQLTEQGQTVQIPIPAGASINAVATSGDDGRLMDNEWQSSALSDGGTLISLVPTAPMFRVEYYIPLNTNGDERQIEFTLPAGYFTSGSSTVEMLLPPSSERISAEPAEETNQTLPDGGHLLRRQGGPIGAEDSIVQTLSYANPTGALAMPEDAGQPQQAPAPAAPQPAPASTSTSKSNNNLLLIGLGVAAVVLIAAGAFGLWRTRPPAPEPEPQPERRPPRRKKSQQKTSASHTHTGKDKYCRTCGNEFAADDRFCRKCGAKRV